VRSAADPPPTTTAPAHTDATGQSSPTGRSAPSPAAASPAGATTGAAPPRRVAPDSTRIPTLNRPSATAVGTVVWLTSELMFFAGVFGIYFTAKAVGTDPWPPPDTPLHLGYGVGLTAVAVLSSTLCQLGIAAASRGDRASLRRWYLLTALAGALFAAGQIAQYGTFIAGGAGIGSSSFSTVFFLLTAFHLLHLVVGIIAVAVTAARADPATLTSQRATRAVVLGYFWHFLTVLWLAVFAAIYLIR
jgi:cytochrome c oxidase subunit 3